MNRNQLKEQLKTRAKDYLKPDRSKKGYICPICSSGTGKHGTGITTKDGVHFTCWRGCFTSADIIDIIGLEYNISDYNDKLLKAAQIFQLDINKYTNKQYNIQNDIDDKQKKYFKLYFSEVKKLINDTSYHRGLSKQTLDRFNIGYDPEWVHPKAPNAPPSPRLIIPTGDFSYLARDTRLNLTPIQQKYSKSKVGKVQIFNLQAIYTAQKPIFIVEGEIDALSIIDVGGEAVALGSTSNVNLLLSELEKNKPIKPLIIAMDNDTAGGKASNQLIEGLNNLGISFFMLDIASPYKDANEALNADKETFKQKVLSAEQTEKVLLDEKKESLKRQSVLHSLNSFLEDVRIRKNTNAISTGFQSIDNILDGGLYAGLYIVGAISSLGKTTFCLQIADQLAQNGQDVLIFSLEMAKNELIAKSLSRLTAVNSINYSDSTKTAKTTRGILTGDKYEDYDTLDNEIIQKAIKDYSEYAQNIYINEGMGDIGIKEIRQKVESFVNITGKAPIIIIDYLQILAPSDVRATDKQNTDKAVLELKRISRDYNIPVIGISSFNRDNYTAPVNLSSFKESGAIEYSSDVLIGLQYEGMDYEEGETEKNRDKRIRELTKRNILLGKQGKTQRIQVKILKNRNGSKGDCTLEFYPMFNYFIDSEYNKRPDYGWAKSESSWECASSSWDSVRNSTAF